MGGGHTAWTGWGADLLKGRGGVSTLLSPSYFYIVGEYILHCHLPENKKTCEKKILNSRVGQSMTCNYLCSTHPDVSSTGTIDTLRRRNTSICRQFTECIALRPYVSLTRFGECVATRIHWGTKKRAQLTQPSAPFVVFIVQWSAPRFTSSVSAMGHDDMELHQIRLFEAETGNLS